MVLGEFKSANLDKLLNKEQKVKTRFEPYCRQHDKVLTTSYEVRREGPILFILKFILKDEDS